MKLNMKTKNINEIGIMAKIKNLMSYRNDYVFMKIFSRLYFFKKIFLYFSRLPSSVDSRSAVEKTEDPVRLLNSDGLNLVVSDLHKEGCSAKLKLSGNAISQILAFAYRSPCYAYGDPKKGFKLEDKLSYEEVLCKNILLAKYLNFQNREIFKNLRASSLLRGIAKKYLGDASECIATQLWWTFPADVDDTVRSKAAHFFHRDVDAWGFVKFFFYLTDVSEGGGAHVYVKGSHKPSTISQVFQEKLRINRHHDRSIIKRFGSDLVTPFYGSIGTGIAADTFGFHKGESPVKNPRLMLCLVYATKDYGVQEFRVDPKELGEVYLN